MLHLLNPLLHTKWHSLQNLFRSRIRLETSHILRNFGSCSWCKPNENCHLLFFTQFIPVKVSESVRFLKQLIYNALSIPLLITAQCLQWRRSLKDPASGQNQVAQHWSGPPDFFGSPSSKTGSIGVLGFENFIWNFGSLGTSCRNAPSPFYQRNSLQHCENGTKKNGKKMCCLIPILAGTWWYSAIGSLGFFG